jgi:CSLREA domain-containing protein
MKLQSKWFFLILIAFTAILISACCRPTFTVTKTADTNDGTCSTWDCSLREAVIASNTCSGAQAIEIPAGGYTLTIPGIDEDAAATGDLDLTDDVTITGIAAPSIHGNVDRAFHILPGVHATFDHIWLADGTAINGGALANEGTLTATSFTCNYNTAELPLEGMGDAKGGCIYNLGTAEVFYGQFLANNAKLGGAVFNETDAVFSSISTNYTGNIAEQHGGAILNALDASLTINGGDYRLNEAGTHGGAIWNKGSFSAGNLTFEENTAAYNGGAVYNWAPGTTHFENAWLTLNSADLGGGLFNSEGMVHLYRSGVTANTANTGGGLYNQGPAPSTGMFLENVTVSGNTATSGLGAGIYTDSNFDFRFITIANNSGEGLRIDGGAEIKLRSSALSNNSGGDCGGITPDSLDYNIVSDSTCALLGPHDLLATDPLLEPLAHLGGRAPSHALGVGSPALDSGVPDLCIAMDQITTPRPQGPLCDRGAIENIYTKGIIRGWTYTDEDDDSVKDPGEGAVPGANLTLKVGICPGGADVLTETTDTLGFYEMVDIEPGDYCLATDPLQQTLDPVEQNVSISEGDILEDINFRYVFPVPDASASGLVWHDLCAVPFSPPSTPPPGCVDLGGGSFAADGIYDPGEPGIPGLMVRIGTGPCPISLILTEVPTNSNGEFEFAYLFGGATYCIEVDQHLSPWNDAVLLPGEWSYPERFASPAQVEISPAVNEDLTGINFGWDYEFLPFPPLGLRQCYVIEPAHLRFGPAMDFPIEDSLPEGYPVEILAKSTHEPLWLKVRGLKGEMGWIFSELVNCGETDFEDVESERDPAMPKPTRDPNKKPDEDSPDCNPNLSERECIAAGGNWNTDKFFCQCP